MRLTFKHLQLLGPALLLAAAADSRGGLPEFEEQVIDTDAARIAVYAVTNADVNGDGRPDIVAVNERQVVWYENPDWRKRILIENRTEPDNVCIASHDIDGDGQVDFALGAGWTKIGTLQWLTRGESLDQPWRVHAIGVEPWTHRMCFADVLGTGTPQLIVSPLNATQGNGVRLLAFEIPADPATAPWPATILNDALNRMHNHWPARLADDSPTVLFTASQEGLFAVYRETVNGQIVSTRVGSGMPGSTPETSGAGEVKLGRLRDGRPFLATIEPMHGTTVAVYRLSPKWSEGELAPRTVIEDSLKGGHAVWTADLNGDGGDEIVIGHREPGDGPVTGPGVYVYAAADAEGTQWTRHVIDDGGMACEDLFCADLDGDGSPEIVAGGRSTRNLKLYRRR